MKFSRYLASICDIREVTREYSIVSLKNLEKKESKQEWNHVRNMPFE